MLRYRLELQPDDNGTVLVTSPDLPIVTYGESNAVAFRNATEAAVSLLASMMSRREDIPLPAPEDQDGSAYLHLPLQTELKIQLYRALQGSGMTRADLQRRLGWQRESVDRLFRLDHNSRIEQIDQAFRAIGKTVNVQIGEAA